MALLERNYRGSDLIGGGLQRELPYRRGITEAVALLERNYRGSDLIRGGLAL